MTTGRPGTVKALPLAVAGCALLLAAACGGDPAPAATAGAGAGAAGTPISIASVGSLTSSVFQAPEYKAGMLAAVESVNASGGVQGHKLVLDFCDSGYTLNGEVSCARRIAAKKADAVVGPNFNVDQSGSTWKLLETAKIPVIGGQGGSPVELNASNVYPLGSGVPGAFVGTAAAVADAGANKVVVLTDTNPTGPFAAQLIAGALKPASITPTTVTADASSDPTFATAAAKAAGGGTDGVILVAAPNNVAKMVGALKAGGYTGTIAVPSTLLPQQSLVALKSAADGIIVDSQVAFASDTNNPGVARFTADMRKYQGTAVLNDFSLTAWSAVQLFAKAAGSARTFDAAGLTAAFDAVSTPIDIGSVAPWSVTGKTSQVPDFARIVNPLVTFGVVRSEKVVPDGKGFSDPFALRR